MIQSPLLLSVIHLIQSNEIDFRFHFTIVQYYIQYISIFHIIFTSSSFYLIMLRYDQLHVAANTTTSSPDRFHDGFRDWLYREILPRALLTDSRAGSGVGPQAGPTSGPPDRFHHPWPVPQLVLPFRSWTVIPWWDIRGRRFLNIISSMEMINLKTVLKFGHAFLFRRISSLYK